MTTRSLSIFVNSRGHARVDTDCQPERWLSGACVAQLLQLVSGSSDMANAVIHRRLVWSAL